MPSYQDQLNRTVDIPSSPQRIVSLCPSITETLVAFDLDERLVGRTRFCIHPKTAVKQITRVGGTKDVNMERLKELQPDLIIAEKEENIREQVEEMAQHWPVYVTDVRDVPSAIEMIRRVGEICAKKAEGNAMAQRAEQAYQQLGHKTQSERTAYFIWREPWMLAGKDTYIQDVLQRLGFENVGLELEGRYPQVTEEQLRALAPQRVLLSSEPYPFAEKHITELQALLPNAKIELVDGELFSWYGVRMISAAEIMSTKYMSAE
ncbi:MAG: ABC transporter substrate-binding protein [Bacteroidia bacterium]